MGILDGLFKKNRADWCSGCKTEKTVVSHLLFWMPMTVGHYVSHKNADYYLKNLRPVANKAQIPAGYYACETKMYRCTLCGRRTAALRIFLPVREQEKVEETVTFSNGELDTLPGFYYI